MAKKRSIAEILDYDGDDDGDGTRRIYNFRVLLPIGESLEISVQDPKSDMCISDFIGLLKEEYFRAKRMGLLKENHCMKWNSHELHLEDANDNEIRSLIGFKNYKPHKCHILRLCEGSGQPTGIFKDMWDLTPDTELLLELPEEYTFETALADLIDNSLQAVWTIPSNYRRLICVDIAEDKISIFDSGPGMDCNDENCLVKWGKIGASIHRSKTALAVGGRPPYLVPFFGLFGYGGTIASMHLGRHAMVSSKTLNSNRVYMLHLERGALVRNSGAQKPWKTDGGIRNPTEDETAKSPHGSFTKVEIFDPKVKNINVFQLQCRMKDIYFPYIQCDELSNEGRTQRPVEFQINGVDLTEIEGGEVAISNLHSSNGPDFALQIRFSLAKKDFSGNSGPAATCEANARLKCVYLPIVQGKENINRVLEELESRGCGLSENYESFSRVSIRRLGRLLPDARWTYLPFMDMRHKKGDNAHIVKRCCQRVKCFIETDAGFNPTPSKTDFAHHSPFTIALKNLGCSTNGEKDIHSEIYRNGKLLTLVQLEKEYSDWIVQMHGCYDEELDSGQDQPVVIFVNPSYMKALGVSSKVIRVHEVIKRMGREWKRGQKIKILKGACAKVHKNNIYATLEYFLLEGLEGDGGGDARIICRPLPVPTERGCTQRIRDGNATLELNDSLSLPVNIIDFQKLVAVERAEWESQLEKQRLKAPSVIDILDADHCRELDISELLPLDDLIHAGQDLQRNIVAVLRPAKFNKSNALKLEQKHIVKTNVEMLLEVKYEEDASNGQDIHLYSARVAPCSHKGIHGIYIFSLGHNPEIFRKAGIYRFSFSVVGNQNLNCEKQMRVHASPVVASWRLAGDVKKGSICGSVGSSFPSLSIVCSDKYGNQTLFQCPPKVSIKLTINGSHVLFNKMRLELSASKLILNIKHLLLECGNLDEIQPHYKAMLEICQQDGSLSLSIPCEVFPGPPHEVVAHPSISSNHLLPGCVIEKLKLEMFDAYGNHVLKGSEIQLNIDGFKFIKDNMGSMLKVEDKGFIDLSGLLEVTAGYGKKASILILAGDRTIFREYFQIEERKLRVSSLVAEYYIAGSEVEDLVFEVINAEGMVDEAFHNEDKYGKVHKLTVRCSSSGYDAVFTFSNGRCVVPGIPLPVCAGNFCLFAAHSRHPELQVTVKLNIILPPAVEHDISPSGSCQAVSPILESCTPNYDESIALNIKGKLDDLLYDFDITGSRIKHHEELLKTLNDTKDEIGQSLIDIQAEHVEPFSTKYMNCFFTKEELEKHIESREQSAASVLCHLLSTTSTEEPETTFASGIIGVVALLGAVEHIELSWILAKYLGEDQMLAVVCRSYEDACKLEKYEQYGEVDRSKALHASATKYGKSIDGQFLVICLEDIRPYEGEFEGIDHQRKLALSNPALPTGEMPTGFVDYAVNMIKLDDNYLETTGTAGGLGLRETLFYRLFGELQVYDTRENMKAARAYAKQGAVSLDGGILRENGFVSLGCWDPTICFPVVKSSRSPAETVKRCRQLELMKAELDATICSIEKVSRALNEDKKKLEEKGRMQQNFFNSVEPFLEHYHLESGSRTENGSS